MTSEIIIWIVLLGVILWAVLSLAGSCTQNYCRCVREPRGDDEEEDEEK